MNSKKPLLSYVQDILNEMSSDSVNSINDTFEAQQIAAIIKSSYFDILYLSQDWTFNRDLFQLEGLGDLTCPTKMKIPINVAHIRNLKYFYDNLWHDVQYCQPEDFADITDGRNADDQNVVIVYNDNNAPIYCFNNQKPQYFTSFNDDYVYFDAYDAAVEDTMTSAHTKFIGLKDVQFIIKDDFIPVLPYNMQAALLNEAKARCFTSIKGVENKTARKFANLLVGRAKKSGAKIEPPIKYVRLGR
jgi:hypothetical protein